MVVSAARGAGAAQDAARAESWIYRRSGNGPWEAAMKGLPEPAGTTISVLAAGPRERGVVYAANHRGIYRSHDQGESWKELGITWPADYERERVAGMVLT
jgi:hypothetical protein